jgi:hypothetical protein
MFRLFPHRQGVKVLRQLQIAHRSGEGREIFRGILRKSRASLGSSVEVVKIHNKRETTSIKTIISKD